jgi:RNA polymerase sigma-70 factor (ECF subfamily)
MLRDAADPGPGPEGLAIRKEEQSVISAALRLLPPEQRAAVFLRYYLDMSEPQIAEVLGRPLGTVKSRLHLARTRLKEELRAEVGENRAYQAEGGTS